jgi:hypothetical protein
MRTKHQLKIILLLTIQVLLLGVCATELVLAQSREGKEIELSFSGGIQNNSFRSPNNFFFSSRVDYDVVKWLKLEPELMSVFASGSTPVYMFNGNVSYNFITDKRSTPFVLIGYGLANRFPFVNWLVMEKDFNVGVFNAGIGMKIFLEKGPAFRIEYRFQRFSSPDPQIEARIYTVQFGLIILL